jgi:molecular chaperone GrpE
VYDNLERALSHQTTDEAFYKGIEMTMTQLNGIFEKLGVKPIEAVGQKFDANLHNAVMHIEDDNYGENEIVEEFQKGFILGDKVIRFSMVKVAN